MNALWTNKQLPVDLLLYMHALWIKIQLTMDDAVAPQEAFLSCVFSQELWLGAWPSLPKPSSSGFDSRTQLQEAFLSCVFSQELWLEA